MPLEFQANLLIKDPIYGYVALTDLEEAIIQSPIFQRLRFITQNGLAFYTYPSIRGSRFEHSIGACHLAGRVMTSIFEHSDDRIIKLFLQKLITDLRTALETTRFSDFKRHFRIKKNDISRAQPGELRPLVHFVIQLVRLLALLHDIGHLPFSHLGEEAVEPYAKEVLGESDYTEYNTIRKELDVKLHEFQGYKIVYRAMGELDKAFCSSDRQIYLDVLRLFYKLRLKGTLKDGSVFSKLYELVASDIDVDRGDYLRRDGYASGIGFGSYDIDRLIDSIAMDEVRREGGKRDFLIAPTDASISAVETFLVERYKLFKWLYYHHSLRYFNYCLSKSLYYVIRLRRQLPGLKDKFRIEYFNYGRYVQEDGFIANEIWLWDVFYLAYIALKGRRQPSADVKQALVYLDVIIRRRKLGFTIWKTHPEYLEFNKELKAVVCQKQDSESMGPQHCKMGNVDLTTTPDGLFFRVILETISSNKQLKEKFLAMFYQEGISLSCGAIKGACPVEGLGEDDKIGTVFLVVNEFEPFARSRISTADQVVSQMEFLLRKKRAGKKMIRLTEVSRLAASLYEAWRSDIQCYLYFIVSDVGLQELVSGDAREGLGRAVQSCFCQTFAKWIDDNSLVTIGA